ncbi:MAG: hypothetical protein ACI8UO_002574 [Verrucomicrobiales bacterium]|jgi:hypothetical protein
MFPYRAVAWALALIFSNFWGESALAGVGESDDSGNPPAPSAETALAGWTEDYELAKARAVHKGADLLICFTVRDWSAVCRRFETDFLRQADFVRSASKNYELVQFDLSEEEEDSIGAQLRRKYEIGGFPAIILANSQGQPYALTGFRPDSLERYVEHIDFLHNENLERRQLLAKAAESKGPERADLLAQALPVLGEHRTPKFYGDIIREIVELDPEDTTGKVDELKFKLADYAYLQEMRRLDTEYRWLQMVELTDKHIDDLNLTGSRKQAVLMNRYDVNRRQGDIRAMILSLQEILEVNPYNPHGQQASELLQSLASQLQ